MTTKKIITSNIFPPIPDRWFDWCAYFDGEEEKAEYGYGATEHDAVVDLLVNVHGLDTYVIGVDRDTITCVVCGRTSYHPEDIRQRYCGYCKHFHDDLK